MLSFRKVFLFALEHAEGVGDDLPGIRGVDDVVDIAPFGREVGARGLLGCLLYTSPSPRDS